MSANHELNPVRVRQPRNPFRVGRLLCIRLPRVVAALQPWAEISQRLRRICSILTTEFYSSFRYLAATDAVATPPRLLRTVMFCGFVETLSSPLYCPPPLFESVPRSCPVEVTNTRSVALLLVLVASTRKTRFPLSNSARVILTVSVLGGGGGGGAVTGLIVSVLLRVTPLKVPLMIALIVAFTVPVVTVKLADDAPAATVTLAGTVAVALLLARVTTVAAGAAALKVTVP